MLKLALARVSMPPCTRQCVADRLLVKVFREPLKIDFLLIKTSIATTQHGLKPILQELLEVPFIVFYRLQKNRQGTNKIFGHIYVGR